MLHFNHVSISVAFLPITFIALSKRCSTIIML